MKHLQAHKIGVFYAASALLLLLAAILGILLGATEIGIPDLWNALWSGDAASPAARIVRFVRLPRVLGSLLCGAALSLSGAVIQSVLANRLASPSIIGVNAGAGLAVTLCAAFGIVGGFRLSLCAFAGAFLAVIPISIGARKWGASKGTVILMGVAMNALLGAISDTVTVFHPDVAVQSVDFKVGDFSAVTYPKLLPAAVLILFAAVVLLALSKELEVLSLGEETAKGLGLRTGGARILFLLLATLLAGAAVSLAGLLSFVGLLVPHAVRRLSGTGKHLLPLCALFGGGFVSLCDTLSRTVFAPYELPVGILMAFCGAPFFLALLTKGKGGHPHA